MRQNRYLVLAAQWPKLESDQALIYSCNVAISINALDCISLTVLFNYIADFMAG